MEGFSAALARLADASQACPKLRQHADRLLKRVMTPEEYACRGKVACAALLSLLQPVTLRASACTSSLPLSVPCCICMTEETACSEPRRDVAYLPCLHTFHTACIQEWLERGKDSCPVCNTPVLLNVQKLLQSQ